MTSDDMKKDGPSFSEELNDFLSHLDSLRKMVPLLHMVATALLKNYRGELDEFVEEHDIDRREEGDQQIVFRVPPEHVREFRKLHDKYDSAGRATKIVPRTFVVALVSQYDAFLGGLIRILFHHRPDLLRRAERQLSYAELLDFDSVSEAQEFLLDQEVESVLRRSHADQISWLESKLETPLNKNLAIWPDFIELTERRNLFVHTGGHVTAQYVAVCEKHGVRLAEDLEMGDELKATAKYFMRSCDCLTEMGTKLTHVMWRKLDPDDRASADKNLNVISHDLIRDNRERLALALLEFATGTIKRYSSEQAALYFKLNQAQAHKWLGHDDKYMSILEGIDWTAKGLQYQIARAVLMDDFEEASEVMRQIGKDGEIPKNAYNGWAIFREFRRSELFQQTYQNIFDEEFRVEEQERSNLLIEREDG